MPPKPTCKVVKREGQRGARIDPKGCKVRTTKDAQGNKRQYNKHGLRLGLNTLESCNCGGAVLSVRSVIVASQHFELSRAWSVDVG